MKLLFLLILVLMIAGGGYIFYTQKPVLNQPTTISYRPSPVVTVTESDDSADLTALERDLLELDSLDAELQTNTNNL